MAHVGITTSGFFDDEAFFGDGMLDMIGWNSSLVLQEGLHTG